MKCAQIAPEENMASSEDQVIATTSIKDSVAACDDGVAQEAVQLNDQNPTEDDEASNRLPILPREILKQIVTHAMTAKNHRLNNRCLKYGRSRYEKVNTACLVLDRDLYHVARQALFRQNTFIFNHFGTEIPKIANSVGLWACRQEECLHGGGPPVIDDAVFNLGCDINPERSLIRVQAFEVILENLRHRPLNINTLTLNIAAYCWRSDDQLKAFCKELANVKVHRKLVLSGLDVHLELRIRDLPKALGLNVQPAEWKTKFRTADWQDMGYFWSMYVPMGNGADKTNSLDENTIKDPVAEYRKWLKTARQDWIVNGLDYVTDYAMSP